ncbi:MAG: prepilin-type N-terminal cleavage/methylation domain-containing protein [Chitinispirillaceae bacterium]|nr:prepilin-type N-terminal cleavage/methylation domain-containing protein [Chitinispirillaceae bacterium]
MMKTVKNQSGVSLVEMLVSSAVSTVIGGVIYTIFLMYSNQSSSTISSLVMQQQYDNVSHQIARDVRRASFVLETGETPASYSAGFDTVTSIIMLDQNGVVFAQYVLSGSQLLEGDQQQPYEAGGGTVNVVSGASSFVLDPQRRSLTVNLSLSKNDFSQTHTISARKDVFLCRNR